MINSILGIKPFSDDQSFFDSANSGLFALWHAALWTAKLILLSDYKAH
jgi:hypothetical protein